MDLTILLLAGIWAFISNYFYPILALITALFGLIFLAAIAMNLKIMMSTLINIDRSLLDIQQSLRNRQ